MDTGYGEDSGNHQDDAEGVAPIKMYNPMEEAANRYWRASRIWRDKEESTWSFGDMIQELRGIFCYRGFAPVLAEGLLNDVVEDKRPNGGVCPYTEPTPAIANDSQ